MVSLASLEGWFAQAGSTVLGYSGGVDSALLAVVASRVLGPERFLAVIGRSASYPEVQWAAARELADRFGIPLEEVDTEELRDPAYRANPTDRCYFCKRELWAKLGAVWRERGFDVLIDGTNTDDLREHRPGAVAGREAGIRSPLVELGWDKAAVRRAARVLGLPTWDAPAAPCLSSRIQYGLEVTSGRLAQVEQAEAFVRSLGVIGDLRVRHHGETARIEADPSMFALLDQGWPSIVRRFRDLGWRGVERDPRGYRRGGLLPA